jgi:primosomal protein N' (replication factor Y)
MVTKGHDFPDVTLVGVVMADLSLMVSDYRACEKTFSLLTQVVGRAGRGKKKGCAVIQTANSTSEIMELCTTQDYETFYNGEIALRRALLFRPFCSLGTFTLSSDSETEVEKASQKLSDIIGTLLGEEFSEVEIIAQGPFEASPYKLKNQYRQKLVVKYANTQRTREMFRAEEKRRNEKED